MPFKPGNPHRAKPGNKLALKHGAYSLTELEANFAQLEAQLEADLAANPLPNYQVDNALRDRWVILSAQVKSWLAFFRSHGGLYTKSGNARKGVEALLRTLNTLDKLDRSMAIGQLARAQTIQSLSAGRRDAAEIEARYARMRAKQQLALAAGTAGDLTERPGSESV